jgi:hypothetical protein
MSENFAEQREQPATGQDFRDISLIVDEIERALNRVMLVYFSAQILISLTLFGVMLTALHFSLSPR